MPQSYRSIFARHRRLRTDPQFAWAIERGGDRLLEWVASTAGYIKSLTNRVATRYEVGECNQLLDYVISDESIPSRPVDFCRRDFRPQQTFPDFLASNTEREQNQISVGLRLIARYFDLVLKSTASDENGEVARGFRNPIDIEDIPQQQTPKGKTHRASIPLRYIRHMKEIIEGPYIDGNPTFEWPKTLKLDYLTWIDPATGCRHRIWSPVRANFFLSRFLIPLRGLQTRLLDSGESDFEEYRPSQGGWVGNVGRLAPVNKDAKRSNGLIRKIWDNETGRSFNGLFITTNKTADRIDMFLNSGYEIPWENKDIIDIFCRTRDWQEKYNPCVRPLTRSDLKSDRAMMVSEDVAERLDELCFLFRDAADPRYPQEPITEGRMAHFWNHLVCELERRLEQGNERNRDGTAIRLVQTWSETGQPLAAIFDMHALRVTGLTALIEAGVPIHILSEFVAGHATILMTLYYYKPGAAKVTEVLDEATKRMSEQDDWERFLNSNAPELIHDISVYNSEEWRLSASGTQSALWSIMDEGTCPNGGSLCHIGGPRINDRAYAPVPGGNRNCVMCRFFVTGPKYLAGLVAKSNSNAGVLREKCVRLKESEVQRREISAAYDCEREKTNVMRDRLLTEDEAIETIESEINSRYRTWMAQHKLMIRIKNIIDERIKRNGECSDAIVLNGEVSDFELSLKECSEFDLWDQICRSADVYPSIDPTLPSIRRARLLDVMLTRNERSPAFATLTDQQLKYVGNAWTAHLRALIGEAALSGLVEGQHQLKELGIEAELDALLANIEQPRRVSPLPARLASKSKDSKQQGIVGQKNV